MAYQVGSACYGTALQAAQVAASNQVGAVINHGGSAYFVEAASVMEGSITYGLRPVGGGAPVQLVGAYDAQPCNLLQAADALVLGWQVVAVWIAVYGLMFLAKTFFHMERSDYGNA